MRHAGLIGLLLGLLGCGGPRFPDPGLTTTGFLRPPTYPVQTIVIWDPGYAPAAVQAATVRLAQMGVRVVERSQVDRIFEEQRFQLQHSSDAVADALQVGRMMGADEVVFVDAGMWPPSVMLRGVSVRTGEIRWAGTAQQKGYYGLYGDLEAWAPALVDWALARVFCPPAQWDDRGGCRPAGEKRD